MSAMLQSRPPNRSAEEWRMREIVKTALRQRWPAARIVEEFPLRYSTRRIDLAAFCDHEIVAVEIKSSRDTLDRLEEQLRAFLPIARVIVALAPIWNERLPVKKVQHRDAGQTYDCFVSQFTPAQEIIRRCGSGLIATWSVDGETGLIGGDFPHVGFFQKPHSRQLLDLLHVDELIEIAGRRRIAHARRPRHGDLADACFDLMAGREVIGDVLRALRARAAFAAGSDAPIAIEASELR